MPARLQAVAVTKSLKRVMRYLQTSSSAWQVGLCAAGSPQEQGR